MNYISVVAAVAIALSVSESAHAQTKLTVGYTPSVSMAQLFVAQEQGFFSKHNLDVQFVIGPGNIMVSGLIAASFQVSGPTATTFLQAADSGLDLVEIASANFASKTRPEYGVLIRNGISVEKPSDFVGKKVGVSTIGAFLHVLFVEWLQKNGVDPKQVTFIEIPFPQMSDILRQSSVDAVIAVEPFVTRIRQSNAGTLGPNFLSDIPDQLPVVIFASTRSWAQSNTETMKNFRAALSDATEFIEKDIARTREHINKHLKMPKEVFANVLVPHLKVEPDVRGLQSWIEMMKMQGLLKGELKAQSLIVP